MMDRVHALLLLTLLLGLPTWARADEEPAAAYAAVAKAFPPPADATAFELSGTVEGDGVAVGTFRLAARVESTDAGARWRLQEEIWTTLDDVRTGHEAALLADSTLHPLDGAWKETDEFGDVLDHRWRQTDTGYTVETRSSSRAPMQRQAAKEGPCLTSAAALVLFGRLAPKRDAVYDALTFHPDWDYLQAERPFVKTRIRVQAAARWEDGQAFVVTAQQRVDRVVVALDVETREVLEIQLHGRGPPGWVLRPGPGRSDAPEEEPEEEPFAAPSTTPRACALRVALAFAAIDVALFEAVLHWPTLRAHMKDRIRGEVSDKTFRASILDQFRSQAKGRTAQPKEEVEAALRAQASGFEVERKGETDAVVTLPESYGRMRLTLVRVEGAWYLARLPGT